MRKSILKMAALYFDKLVFPRKAGLWDFPRELEFN